MADFDVAVLGLGGVGSATLLQLARRGLSVIGIDRFVPPHAFGSSHGHTRIIRQAYFEHPDYVPLLAECYREWHELEEYIGKKLYFDIGVLQIGPEAGTVISGIRRAAAEHQLSIQEFSPKSLQIRWPALAVPETMVGILEAKAGYLLVEDCINSQITAARDAGAKVQAPSEVLRWDPGRPIKLHTSNGTITAERLIVSAGSWASSLLQELNLKLEIRRKSVFWFTADQRFTASKGYPCFLYELPQGVFYGFPVIDAQGVKLAEHSGGQTVSDPLQVHREIDPEDERHIDDFRNRYLPDITGKRLNHQTCLYTMSPDEHFIVDRHPQAENVVFAAGLSGHGFKFSPILGRALSDLSLDGGTQLPIEFLSVRRFSSSSQ